MSTFAAKQQQGEQEELPDIYRMGNLKRRKDKDKRGGASNSNSPNPPRDLPEPPEKSPPAGAGEAEKVTRKKGGIKKGTGLFATKPAAAMINKKGSKTKDVPKKVPSGGNNVSKNASGVGKAGDRAGGKGVADGDNQEQQLLDAGETDGTDDIPQEYRDSLGNFKMMPVPRHLGSLTRRRPPLVAVVGVAGCGKSRLASALMGREKERELRAVFGVGQKTVTPKLVVGEELSVLDTPGLPDPIPRNSDTYYNDTVMKLRSVGYANAILFVVNQERVTPTLIKNYGLLYRALNRLDCVKMFVLRRETSFLLLNIADQEAHEAESRTTVNQILAATNLKNWSTKQFFMLTNGSGEEQDKQIKYMREQVRKSPKVEITAEEGLRLTTEVSSEDMGGKGSDDGSNSGGSTNGRNSRRMSKKRDSLNSPTVDKTGVKSAKSGCSLM